MSQVGTQYCTGHFWDTILSTLGFSLQRSKKIPNTTTYLVLADICWLRLDFETFTTLGPADTVETDGGLCVDKLTFTVTSGQQIPELCGTLTGQHSKI